MNTSIFHAAFATFAVLGLAANLQAQSNDDLFGVIEIGSSGVKPLMLKALPDQTSDDPEQSVNSFNVEKVTVEDLTPLVESQAPKVAAAVAAVRQQMIEKMGVPAEHVYIVGSSGLGGVEASRKAVAAQIKEKLGIEMEFIAADQEAELAFTGVMSTVPANFRQQRYREVLFLDIGSGNTKGAYMASEKPFVVKAFEMPWGTKKFADFVDKERGDTPFAEAAEQYRRSHLRPSLRENAGLVPGLDQLRRCYLAGGASFALATVLHPAQKSRTEGFVYLDRGDIPKFLAAVQDASDALAPDLQKPGRKKLTIEQYFQERLGEAMKDLAKNGVPEAKRNEMKARAEADMQTIMKKVFSGNQMIAAAKLLQTMDAEFGIDRKSVLFAQNALYAWPFGYVKRKINAAR